MYQALRAAAWLLVLVVVVFYTVGKAHVELGELWNSSAQARREIRLVPFNEFWDPTVWYGPLQNLLGNVGLFLPVGFLVCNARRGALVGLALSLGIEITQFVTASGYSDIDDLVYNTAGAALGGWVAARLSPRDLVTGVWIIVAGAIVLIVPFLAAMLA
ncbi:Glycopeptide antibiotics resistance protein [Corynebacterium mycetoides]|uniref:Glycopeptide antibiotics resistance protein n=2 Tax=Corynebacterium mycetoides TaxID=38302 RepID=A0A1G9PRU9_9CORY|nr:Glycopeptide antibiotics resistance protein [Corynebacterium mycetoides]